MRQRKRQRLDEVKSLQGCRVCGETDPVVLDFDHLDPSLKHPKLRTVGGNWGKLSWGEMEQELGKVQVLCANDHRRKTQGASV